MLKREITYEDADGNTVTETFEFHLTLKELIKLLGGNEETTMEEAIKQLENRGLKELVMEFDNFVLSSYGVRSEDKKRFIKNDQLREEFAESFAYDALFTEFMTSETAADDFFMAILPQNLKEEFARMQKLNQAQTTPPLPPAEG